MTLIMIAAILVIALVAVMIMMVHRVLLVMTMRDLALVMRWFSMSLATDRSFTPTTMTGFVRGTIIECMSPIMTRESRLVTISFITTAF